MNRQHLDSKKTLLVPSFSFSYVEASGVSSPEVNHVCGNNRSASWTVDKLASIYSAGLHLNKPSNFVADSALTVLLHFSRLNQTALLASYFMRPLSSGG